MLNTTKKLSIAKKQKQVKLGRRFYRKKIVVSPILGYKCLALGWSRFLGSQPAGDRCFVIYCQLINISHALLIDVVLKIFPNCIIHWTKVGAVKWPAVGRDQFLYCLVQIFNGGIWWELRSIIHLSLFRGHRVFLRCGVFSYNGVAINWQVMWLIVTEVRSASARGAPLASVSTTPYYVAVLSMGQSLILRPLYFSSSSVVLRAFSAQCVYSTFGHHPHPLGYLCAKLCFFCDLCGWASPMEKNCVLN